jgi:hypothetical protein
MRGGYTHPFGVAAASSQTADLSSDPVAGDLGAYLVHYTADLQPQRGRGARRRRIAAFTLRKVRAINPSGSDANAHLPFAWERYSGFSQP